MSEYNFDEMTTIALAEFFDEGEEGYRQKLVILKHKDKLVVIPGYDLDYNPEDGSWESDAKVFLQRLGHERAYVGKVVDPKTLSREQLMGCVKEAYEDDLIDR
jgi:hypothetical protein